MGKVLIWQSIIYEGIKAKSVRDMRLWRIVVVIKTGKLSYLQCGQEKDGWPH